MPKLRLAPKVFAAVFIVAASTIAVGTMAFVALTRIESAIVDLKDSDARRQLAGTAAVSFLGYALSLEQIGRVSSGDDKAPYEQRAEQLFAEVSNWLDILEPRLLTKASADELARIRKDLAAIRAVQPTIQMLSHIGDSQGSAVRLAGIEAAVANSKDLLAGIERRNAGFAQDASDRVIGEQESARRLIALVSIFGVSVALVMALAILVSRVTRPLTAIEAAVRRLAAGDTDIDLPKPRGHDEIAVLTRAVATFRENALRIRTLTAEEADRKRAAEAERAALMHGLAEEFDRAVSSVVDGTRTAAEQLTQAAAALEDSAAAAGRRGVAVSQAALEASANVAMVASAAEQLDASVAEIAAQVSRSASIADRATAEAGRGAENVRVQSEAARRIGDVVEVINTLAAQTNLLALNATIEAARAGEAGRGFAVVASEVKTLADQTARATGQIAAQVRDIQGATSHSSAAIGAIVGTIEAMSEISNGIAAAMEEQRASTNEIARNVREASRGTDEVSETIGQVSEASLKTGAAAAQVRALADAIVEQADTLRMSVDHFLGNVRGEARAAA